MDNNKIDSWISAIINEDGHNLSSGSLRTLKMIRYEIQKSCQLIEESEQDELWDDIIASCFAANLAEPKKRSLLIKELSSKYIIIKR